MKSFFFLLAIPPIIYIAECHPGHEMSAFSAVLILVAISFTTFLFSKEEA